MHIRKRYLMLLALLLGGMAWYLGARFVEQNDERQYSMSLQELRGVTKLVLWEQDFVVNDFESQQKTYFNLFKSKESVLSTVKGKMGFHINIADSMHTSISRIKDTIIIKAPLRITYVSLDMGTLQQVKENSIDPSINVDKNEVIKHLDQIALQKYLPQVAAALKNKDMKTQEKQLSRLTGKPIKIVLTQMPKATDWNESQ